MSDAASGVSRPDREEMPRDVDALLVRSIARWAVLVSLALFLYDLAILRSWPFPDVLDGLRGPVYALVGAVLVLASLFITFLGYRIVTMRVVVRSRLLYVIFLPGVILVASVVGILLLAAPR